LRTSHSDTTFKHVLLPVWTAGFSFRKKTYRFVVNGRTGKGRGERPYSKLKIALAGAAVLAAILGFLAVAGQSGAFRGGFDNGIQTRSPIDWGREPAPSRWPDVPLDGRIPRIEFPELPNSWQF